MTWLAAAANDIQDYQANLKSLIFTGVFFLLLIVAAIWWLRR